MFHVVSYDENSMHNRDGPGGKISLRAELITLERWLDLGFAEKFESRFEGVFKELWRTFAMVAKISIQALPSALSRSQRTKSPH